MKNTKNSAFGKIVEKKLIDLEKSRAWLQHECGLTQTQLGRYIRGITVPSALVVFRIANVLDLDYGELLEAIASEEKERV